MDTLHRKKVEKVQKLEKVKNKKDTLAFILSHFGLISPLMFFCVFFSDVMVILYLAKKGLIYRHV